MSKLVWYLPVAIFISLVLGACNLPGGSQDAEGVDAASTAAAQTVEANLTQAAILNPPTLPVISTSTTAAPSDTFPTPTNTQPAAPPTLECDKAQFIDDITIPDGTILAPDEPFTKTWRLKNIGTCSWTTTYVVIFNNGDAMSGPVTQALTGNVNPNQTVDISVDLIAPSTDDDYKGFWKLRNAAGVLFAQFYVEIIVETPAPSTTTITLNATGGTEGGTVYEPASGIPSTILAGDTGSNGLARGFMSFDISSISGKTVTAATLDLSSCTQMQDPFDGAGLAGIWVGELQYGLPLAQSAYNLSGTGIQLLTTLPGSAIDVKSYVQARVSEPKPRFQIHLYPKEGSDNDGQADYMSCSANGPKLTITYQP